MGLTEALSAPYRPTGPSNRFGQACTDMLQYTLRPSTGLFPLGSRLSGGVWSPKTVARPAWA